MIIWTRRKEVLGGPAIVICETVGCLNKWTYVRPEVGVHYEYSAQPGYWTLSARDLDRDYLLSRAITLTREEP